MRNKRESGQSGRASNSCDPQRLFFEETQAILATMRQVQQVQKESARRREQSLAINTELARMRGDYGGSVGSTPTKDSRQDEPAADKPADGNGRTIMSSDHHAVPRLSESDDRAAASRAGAMQVLTAANQNLLEAGYDVVDILDAAMKFALDRLLQTVGRTEAVRYLRYVSEQIDGEAH
jgi:hypothetical protein